jgi:phosphatidylglycerophosphatase A
MSKSEIKKDSKQFFKNMIKIHEFFLTFFYCGKIKKAPGTFASFVALLLWFILEKLFYMWQVTIYSQNIFWTIFLASAFIYGCIAIASYTRQFGQIDHQTVVLDEVVGQILTLQFTFLQLSEKYFSDILLIIFHLAFCFILFRFFDITKPSIIGYADRIKNGFGVMFDDLLCAIIIIIIAFFGVFLLLYFKVDVHLSSIAS